MSMREFASNEIFDQDENDSLEKEIEGEKLTETITSQISTCRFIPH